MQRSRSLVSQMSAVEEKREREGTPTYIPIHLFECVAMRAINALLSAVITTPPAESVGASRQTAEPLDVSLTHSLNLSNLPQEARLKEPREMTTVTPPKHYC